MTLDVRRVGPEAAADVLAVVQRAFGARPALDPPAVALADDLDSITRLLGGRGGLLATLDGRPAGCLVLHAVPGGLTLRRFGVTPDAQGKGVAAALIEAAHRAAVGREALIVVAREELPETMAFWERHGFVVRTRSSPDVVMHHDLDRSFDAAGADEMRDLGSGSDTRSARVTSSCSPVSWGRARPPSPRGWGRACACGVR